MIFQDLLVFEENSFILAWVLVPSYLFGSTLINILYMYVYIFQAAQVSAKKALSDADTSVCSEVSSV